jgi:hypothetical protein
MAHRENSPSAKLHKIFDEKGQEAAKKAAERLGLQPHTARSLFSRWNNPESGKKKTKRVKASAPKKSAKKSAKKAAPKKAAKKVSRERLPAEATAA